MNIGRAPHEGFHLPTQHLKSEASRGPAFQWEASGHLALDLPRANAGKAASGRKSGV
jgi:hypothetical protein